MSYKINYQYLLSYLGFIPYIIVIIDKYFFYLINEDIYKNFLVYYTILIIVFIGAINWNLKKKIGIFRALYGFIPSLFSTIVLILNQFNFSFYSQFFLLIIFMLIQLICDRFIIYSKYTNIFYHLRLPLTLGISLSLIFTLI